MSDSPNPLPGLALDHVGIACGDLDTAMARFAAFGYAPGPVLAVPEQGVRVVFLDIPGASGGRIELLTPEPAGSGPVAKFLAGHGEGMHHLAFRTGDVEAELARLEGKGYRAVRTKSGGDAVRSGAHGSRVAFLHPRSAGGVLIELVEPRSGETN